MSIKHYVKLSLNQSKEFLTDFARCFATIYLGDHPKFIGVIMVLSAKVMNADNFQEVIGSFIPLLLLISAVVFFR